MELQFELFSLWHSDHPAACPGYVKPSDLTVNDSAPAACKAMAQDKVYILSELVLSTQLSESTRLHFIYCYVNLGSLKPTWNEDNKFQRFVRPLARSKLDIRMNRLNMVWFLNHTI